MRHALKQLPAWAVVLVLFVVPVLAVSGVGYVVVSGESEPAGPAIARGASGGSFHPVAGNFVPDDLTLESCDGDRDYACLQQAFGNVAYRQGAKPALALFEARTAADERVRTDCHRIAHVIGSAAFARYDENVARTFAVGSPTCASGYYHGILERAFVGVNTKTRLVEVARSLCRDSGVRRRGFLDYQCRHGLGHGLMIQTGYDLPIALSTCAQLETPWDDVVCTGGVFMENVTTRFGFRSSWLAEEDPLYPCSRVSDRHRDSCYLRAPVQILSYHEGDFSKASSTCAALESRWATACFRGLGRETVSVAHQSKRKILSLCRLSGAFVGECLYGAARTVGDGSGLVGARDAATLCRRAPRVERGSCFGGVGIIVGLLYSTDRARERGCAGIAGAYASACARAALAEVDPSGRGAWG